MKMGKEDFSDFISNALENKDIPQIYFNGFTASISASDVLIVLKRNEQSLAVLNTSHVIGKTIVELLGNLVAEFEERTETHIMTSNQMKEKLEELIESGDDD
jgi:hypothetical protein